MYNSVNGKLKKDELGITFIHEHLYVVPNDLPKYEDFTFDDIDPIIQEVAMFKAKGGQTIVDLTPINYGRNPIALKKIAEQTNTNVMFVTGFHKEEFQPKWLEDMSYIEVYDFLIKEIRQGVSSQKLLPSAVKLGTSYNEITANEKKIIEIIANIQKDTGIPIITHCDKGSMGIEQLEMLSKNGADITKVCLSHVDLSKDLNYLVELCKMGASISFDHIGRNLMNQDSEAINLLTQLVDFGYHSNICLSGDMGRKKYLKAYNGKPGLDYILTTFRELTVPYIGADHYTQMIRENPQRLLKWNID